MAGRGVWDQEPMDSTLDGQVMLVKGKHRYVFRYQRGSELQALDAFVSLASNAQSDFDWFDAAVLSYQISKNLHDSDGLAGQDSDLSDPQEECWS